MTTSNRWQKLAQVAAHAVFWPWNVLFVCLVAIGFTPLVLVDLVVDATDGLARWDFVVCAVLLVVWPIAILLHALLRLRTRPADLVSLFLGVELPVFFLLGVRLFGFQDLQGAGAFVVDVLLVGGCAAALRTLWLDRRETPRVPWLDVVTHVALAGLATAGVYVGFLLSLATLPVLATALVAIVRAVPAAISHVQFDSLVVALVALIPASWFGLSALLALFLPWIAPVSWVTTWMRSGRLLRARLGVGSMALLTVVPVLAVVLVTVQLLPQPHTDAMARLREPPHDDVERRALVADREQIRAGLVDAYLLGLRYLDVDDPKEAQARSDIWTGAWRDLVGNEQAHAIASFARQLARPFLYAGPSDDAVEAGRLYRDFFGAHLERDNAAVVKHAMTATWSREQRVEGFINSGDRRAWLVQQELTTHDAGGIVDVTVHDEWQNLTVTDTEVVLFFELPETAALTGLWLSPDGKRENAFAFTVSPRGAAQQVFHEQIERRQDPALLEQIGPRQYRLRVFPVPAKRVQDGHMHWGTDSWRNDAGQHQHVWLTYQALPIVDDGTPAHVPFPIVRERRNAFWDTHTRRSLNGVPIPALDADDVSDGGDAWVQAPAVPLLAAAVSGVVDGACFHVGPTSTAGETLAGKTVVVVVDRSLSVADHKPELTAALHALRESGATLRYVLGTSSLRGENAAATPDVDVNALVFFGAASIRELVQPLLAEPALGAAGADAVVVLAAQGTLDTATDTAPSSSTPLPRTVVVHLGGKMPAGYDDNTLDAIRRSGGTTTARIDDAIHRLQGRTTAEGWEVTRCDPSTTTLSDRATALVTRVAIAAADAEGPVHDVAALDRLHAWAKAASIVTPYSSMIVLVDDVQRERLRQLEAQQDRFEREVEKGAQAAPSPLHWVEGTPEPEDAVLVVSALGALLAVVRRRRGGLDAPRR
jgi:putative PEP-CTERM system integral membrane protein